MENTFDLLYPFAIGVAINGLLVGSWLALVPLVSIWLVYTTMGYLRQRYDTRLFTRIYTRIASQMVVEQRNQGEETSEIAARTDMVEELVEFLEDNVPAAMLALFGLVGGALMLFYYDLIAGTVMSLVLVPAGLIYLRFGRAAREMERHFNDRSEREVDLIEDGSSTSIRRHFRNLSRWRVRISNAEAKSWSSIELISLVLFVALLVRMTQIDGIMAGDIFAAVAYAVRMLDALDELPERVSALNRMLDNFTRLK